MNEPLFVIPLWADLIAVGLGGVQGALFASGFQGERRLDLLGVAIIGVVVGMGGGLIRDLLLNVTARDAAEQLVPADGDASRRSIGMLLAGLFQRAQRASSSASTPSSSACSAPSARARRSRSGFPLVPAVFVGVCSAVGGGILRDMIMGLPVAIMHVGSLYAVAAAAGCLVLASPHAFGVAARRRRRSSASS